MRMKKLSYIGLAFVLLAGCQREVDNLRHDAALSFSIRSAGEAVKSGALQHLLSQEEVTTTATGDTLRFWAQEESLEGTCIKASIYAGTTLPEDVSIGFMAYKYETSGAAASAWTLHTSPAVAEAVCDASRGSASSRKWVPVDRLLWPGSGYVKYFAYAPFEAAGATVTAAPGSAPSIAYTVPATYDEQVDLLVADAASSCEYEGDPLVTAIDVPLTFNHLLTAIRFRVGKGLSISGVSIKGVYNKGTLSLGDVTRAWTLDNASKATYTITSPTLKTDPTDSDYSIVNDEYTLILMPQTLPVGAVIEATVTKDSFPKTITAIMEGEVWAPGKLVVYTISDGESLEPDSYYLGQLKSTGIPFPHSGDTQMISKDASFQSYAVMKDESKRPVPFVLEYFVGGTSTPAANAAGWTTTPPSWVAASYNGAGSVNGDAIMVTVAPQVNSATDPYHAPLSNKTSKTDFDLSTSGGTASRSTANSYVVDAPGTYRIPLVYGNGIKNGSANPSAYSDFGATDHLEQAITSPYIALQHPGKSLDAKLLWTDVPGLVGNVSLSGSGADACLCFDVPADYITQGNACVAVLADGVVAWSWHIWVTDVSLAPVTAAGYSFLQVNLGWCDGKDAERYEARPAKLGNDVTYCWIRARQAQSGNTSNIGRIRQEEKIFENATGGNNPFYQWGRKDLMAAGNGFTNTSYGNTQKTYYTAPGYAFLHWEDGPVSIGTGIRTPTRFYNHNNADTYAYADWVYPQNPSLWQDGQKTIYDPSPAGYRVPPKTAFDALVTLGSTWGDNPPGRWVGSVGSVGSLFFPASGIRSFGAGCRIMSTGAHGSYWTTTFASQYAVYDLSFDNSHFSVFDKSTTINGFPIRPMVE